MTNTTKDSLAEAIQDFDDELTEWASAYPLAVFPEPDLKKAHEVLTAAGVTLDAISASNMRHVVTRLSALFEPVRAALAEAAPAEGVEGAEAVGDMLSVLSCIRKDVAASKFGGLQCDELGRQIRAITPHTAPAEGVVALIEAAKFAIKALDEEAAAYGLDRIDHVDKAAAMLRAALASHTAPADKPVGHVNMRTSSGNGDGITWTGWALPHGAPLYASQPAPAVAALRQIANMHPRQHESAFGPRARCQHCNYAWIVGKEVETHATTCAYAIAHNALSGEPAASAPAVAMVGEPDCTTLDAIELICRNNIKANGMHSILQLVQYMRAANPSPPAPQEPSFVDTAKQAFVISESCGPDSSYRLVFRFKSLEELQAAHRAWIVAWIVTKKPDAALDAVRGSLDELRATACGVDVVLVLNGFDLIRRDSVIDLIDRRIAAQKGGV